MKERGAGHHAHRVHAASMDSYVEDGRFFLETVWLRVAFEVIETAIRVYKLEPDEANALREVFGQPRLYSVRLT